jgi:3-deoxy-7-phosphoheptulonate synthase
VILRGGKQPNYGTASVNAACEELAASGLAQRLMVDFSHANSSKDFRRQVEVGADVAGQLAAGERRIAGVMIESHINPGRQDLVPGKSLAYGVSITDACLGWAETVQLLDTLAEGVRKRRVAAEE